MYSNFYFSRIKISMYSSLTNQLKNPLKNPPVIPCKLVYLDIYVSRRIFFSAYLSV